MKSTGDDQILVNVNVIVEIKKPVMKRLAEHDPHGQHQQEANEDRSPTSRRLTFGIGCFASLDGN
jgi:hypothetical protein